MMHGSGGCPGVGMHATLRGPLLNGLQCSRTRDPTVSRCLTHARCLAESRLVLRWIIMLQKYVSSWSLAARKVTCGGSEARVVQPEYGSGKVATTWSGAETRLMFGQPVNADGSIVRMASAPAGGVKAIKVAREVHPLKAPQPMVVTESGIVMLANEVHL